MTTIEAINQGLDQLEARNQCITSKVRDKNALRVRTPMGRASPPSVSGET